MESAGGWLLMHDPTLQLTVCMFGTPSIVNSVVPTGDPLNWNNEIVAGRDGSAYIRVWPKAVLTPGIRRNNDLESPCARGSSSMRWLSATCPTSVEAVSSTGV